MISYDCQLSYLQFEIKQSEKALILLLIDNVNTTTKITSKMGIITWIVMGLIVGLLAKAIVPGKDPGGFIITILLGIGGALLGGYLGTVFGLGTVTGFNIRSILIATGGSILILIIYHALKKK